ncbi:MAG: alpha/beta hydrolase [Lactobacillus sp.]|jgi:acetyl esterase/lipase|nr:alpha/beta hydrolase [Lactobacillus sp.]
MANIKIDKDIEYDAKFGLKLDIYQDADQVSDDRPVIIDIHGGGWWLGYKEEETAWATSFAEQGYLVFVPNYRLAPKYLYPAPVEDMLHLFDWIQQSDYQFDRSKIGAVGMSAGGNLAIELAIRKGIPIATWSGIIDLDAWIEKHPDVVASNKDAPIPGTPVGKINQAGPNDPYYKWFVLNYVNNDLALLKEASPLHRITKDTGKMFIANSLNEIVPNDGIERLQQELTKNLIPSTVQFVAGTGHGEAYMALAQNPTLDFFKNYL